MNEDIDNITAEMDEQRKIMAAAREELTTLNELRSEYLDRHLATLTDEQIMGDEATLRRVLQEAFSHQRASDRAHRLYATGRQDLTAGGMDGRDEWHEGCLPTLKLSLIEGQDVEEVETAIRMWAQTWALGRTSLVISILEHTLSRRGSYHITWPVGKVCGVLEAWPGREILSGPLRALLERVAQQYWYRRPDGSMGNDGYDEDY